MNDRIFAGFTTVLVILTGSVISAQTSSEPFPSPIAASEDVITVGIAEFASLPDVNGEAARMMHFVDEPGTERLFISDMRGLLYSVSYDGQTVTRYLDLTAEAWGLSVEATGRERGFQSFAFHPEFDHPGSPGFGRFYTYFDMRGLLYSVSYDGQTVTRYLDLTAEAWGLSVEATGRERGFQSFAFHPEFDHPGSPGFGRFYTYFDTSNTIPTPDFVPGGDDSAQDTMLVEWTAETPGAATYDGSPPRVLMRIEQPFRNHNGGQIGFNPLASPGDADFGLLYVGSADGGSGGDPLDLAQNTGSVFGKILRIDPLVWAHLSRRRIRACQPTLLQSRSAVTGVVVYRHTVIPQLENLVLFGDTPSGEIFYIQADQLPGGGQNTIRRVLLDDGGEPKTLLQLVQAKNIEQGKPPAQRAVDTEPLAVYVLCEARKLLDYEDPTRQPTSLRMFCHWASHVDLAGRGTTEPFVQRVDHVVTNVLSGTTTADTLAAERALVQEFASFDTFRTHLAARGESRSY